jgi:hypothetical protein
MTHDLKQEVLDFAQKRGLCEGELLALCDYVYRAGVLAGLEIAIDRVRRSKFAAEVDS